MRVHHGRSATTDAFRPPTSLVVALLLLVHAGLWSLVRSPPSRPGPPGPAPLQVVWIEAAPLLLPVPPLPVPPTRQRSLSPAATALPRTTEPRASAPIATDDGSPPPAVLFDADARPLLPEGVASDGGSRLPRDARRLGRSAVRLPGSAEPIVEIGRTRDRATPEQVVLGVAQFLFGRPNPDSCDKIERRLVNHDDALLRDIDLNKWQRLCRGGR